MSGNLTPNTPWQAHLRMQLSEAQQGACPICDQELKGKLSIDHNHETGTIRGLVHQSCNLKIKQVEGCKKFNYIIPKQQRDRILAYLKNHIRVIVIQAGASP